VSRSEFASRQIPPFGSIVARKTGVIAEVGVESFDGEGDGDGPEDDESPDEKTVRAL
jgi:hypothetical protein